MNLSLAWPFQSRPFILGHEYSLLSVSYFSYDVQLLLFHEFYFKYFELHYYIIVWFFVISNLVCLVSESIEIIASKLSTYILVNYFTSSGTGYLHAAYIVQPLVKLVARDIKNSEHLWAFKYCVIIVFPIWRSFQSCYMLQYFSMVVISGRLDAMI